MKTTNEMIDARLIKCTNCGFKCTIIEYLPLLSEKFPGEPVPIYDPKFCPECGQRLEIKEKVKKYTWACITDEGNWYNSGFYMTEDKAHEYFGKKKHIKIESSMIEVAE